MIVNSTPVATISLGALHDTSIDSAPAKACAPIARHLAPARNIGLHFQRWDVAADGSFVNGQRRRQIDAMCCW
jgi:hypothetical protein